MMMSFRILFTACPMNIPVGVGRPSCRINFSRPFRALRIAWIQSFFLPLFDHGGLALSQTGFHWEGYPGSCSGMFIVTMIDSLCCYASSCRAQTLELRRGSIHTSRVLPVLHCFGIGFRLQGCRSGSAPRSASIPSNFVHHATRLEMRPEYACHTIRQKSRTNAPQAPEPDRSLSGECLSLATPSQTSPSAGTMYPFGHGSGRNRIDASVPAPFARPKDMLAAGTDSSQFLAMDHHTGHAVGSAQQRSARPKS